MNKIEDIRRMWRRGESVAAIARATGVSEPTARKHGDMDDLSPEPPRARCPESELPAPYAATVEPWLLDDRKDWHKQRHAAVRACVRLRDEEGYEGSHSTARRHVRRRREEMAAEAETRDAQGFLQLDWVPGECQVDFGQTDFRVRGVPARGHYLTVSCDGAVSVAQPRQLVEDRLNQWVQLVVSCHLASYRRRLYTQ